MKICVVNPDSGLDAAGLKLRVERLRPFARPDTEIVMICPRKNNLCVDSCLDAALDAPESAEMALRAQADGADAVCLYCFSDPGFDACRELLHVPVVGGAQAAVLLASQLALGFSVLTTSARRIPQKKNFLRALGADPARIASVRGVELPPSASRERSEIIEILEACGRRCVEEDGADAVILGCLGFAGMGAELTERLGVPVIDPAAALIATAESLVVQGLSHSKRSWPDPPAARRFWGAGTVEN